MKSPSKILKAPAGMTRQQRRQAERLGGLVEDVLEADRRFFARHVSRNYRVRRASRVEIEQAHLVQQVGTFAEHGYSWFVALRQFAPGVRLRVYFDGPSDNDTDLTDDEARWLYEREVALSPTGQAVEKQMMFVRESIARKGRS